MDKSHRKVQLSDWIKKTFYPDVARPVALEMDGWYEHKKNLKAKGKFAYWFMEDFPDYVIDTLAWFDLSEHLYQVMYWLRMKVVDRYDLIRTRLPRRYNEIDNRMLHGMFEMLRDFVECEKAWMHLAWAKPEERAKYNYTWWHRRFRFTQWRIPQAGLDHLAWEMSLVYNEDMGVEKDNPDYGKRTPQAEAAQETLELYNWWVNVRPNRPDAYDASGWSAACEMRRTRAKAEDPDCDGFMSMFSKSTPEEEAISKVAHAKLFELEKQYDDKDTEMLCRLVKIRSSLWT